MSTNTFDEILTKIKQYDTIILHRHTSPDPDAIGSQAGLARSLRLAFPAKRILCAGSAVNNLAWINEMDEVQDADYQGALVITTDTANTPRISDQRFKDGAYLIKIDHHPNRDPYGDLSYVDDQAPAASQIVADLIIREKLPLTKEVAAALYAGIVGDTGRFMYPDTSAHTFEVAAILTKTGIDISAIARHIADVSFAQAKLQAACMQVMEVDASGAAMAIISQQTMKELQIDIEQTAVAVGTPGHIKDILAWNVFVEKPDGSYRVHYRSKGPVINQLAEAHDGGGHALASGANAKDLAEVHQIFQELIAVTKKYEAANV